jgi:hypothetical protein
MIARTPAFCLFLSNLSLIYLRRAVSRSLQIDYTCLCDPLLTKYVNWQIRDIFLEEYAKKLIFRKSVKNKDFLVYLHIPFQ